MVEGSPPADHGVLRSHLDESGPFKVYSAPPSERTRHAATHLPADEANRDPCVNRLITDSKSSADPNVDASRILDALIELQMAVLSVEEYDNGECFEWQSIRDAWERVRSTVAVADNLSAVVRPREQRRLTELLEEISQEAIFLSIPRLGIIPTGAKGVPLAT